MKTKSLTSGGALAAMICAAALTAGTASAQGEIEVRSSRISAKDPDLAARRLAGSTTTPISPGSYVQTVARFPTVVLGSASYQMSGTGPAFAAPPAQQLNDRIPAVDLLPSFVGGDSLLNVADNFPGDPTQAGTIDNGRFRGAATNDSIRFTSPFDFPVIGVAGPGSSPGIAGPGAIPTQGVIIPGQTQGALRSIGVPSGSSSGTVSTGGGSARGSLRLGGSR